MKEKILIIGAGISGCCIARLFKDANYDVEIREQNNFLGGMCHDEYDDESKCYISLSGPHILHFRKETKEALKFIKKYVKLKKFEHKVICLGNGNFSFWPVNKTYQTLFGALNKYNSTFNEFVESYSKKMWDNNWQNMKGEVLQRFKFKDNDSIDFFDGQQTFIPKNGFEELFKNLTKGIKIKFHSEENFNTIKFNEYKYIILTSSIDSFFNYKFGKLTWRGLDFNFIKINSELKNVLLTPVMNLNTHPEYTRITEYNFLYNSKSKIKTICFEKPTNTSRIYPIKNSTNDAIYSLYKEELLKYPNVVLLGRMAEFKYKDVDTCIMDSQNLFKKLKGGLK